MSEEEIKFKWETSIRPTCVACELGLPADIDTHFTRVALKDPFSGTKDRFYFNYDACPSCGIIYRQAWPTRESVKSYYESIYRQHSVVNIEKEMPIENERARTWVNFLIQTQDWPERGRKPRGIPDRHLDIGCSTGAFGKLLKIYGCMVSLGVEPDNWGEEGKKGLDHVFDDISEVSPSMYHKYDLVSLSHVLEHLEDPIAMMLHIRRLMAPTGRLLLVVPNPTYWMSSIFAFPHLTVWTYRVLKNFLLLCGLEITHRLGGHPDIAVIAKLAEPQYKISPNAPFLSDKLMLLRRLIVGDPTINHWAFSSHGTKSQNYPPKLFAKLSFLFREWYIPLRAVSSTTLFVLRRLLHRAQLRLNRGSNEED